MVIYVGDNEQIRIQEIDDKEDSDIGVYYKEIGLLTKFKKGKIDQAISYAKDYLKDIGEK